MAELAVLNHRVLPNMPATARLTYYDRKEDIINSVPGLLQELEERDRLYRPPYRQTKHPFLLLADELPILADFDEEIEQQYKALNKRLAKEGEETLPVPSLLYLIRRMVLEARKWRCFFIGSGQSFDAEVLPTKVVENLSSRIVFFSSDRRARMSGLENDAIKNLLPAIRRAGSGVMIFDCSRWDGPMIGAIPMLSVEDMLEYLGVTETIQRETPFPSPPPSSGTQSGQLRLSLMSKPFYNTTTQSTTMPDLPQRQTGPITPAPLFDDEDDETEESTVTGQGFVMGPAEPVRPVYTSEQEARICAAAARLAQKKPAGFTRKDIMEEIGWTRKQWPIIKAVCDKYQFAVPAQQEQDHQDYAEID
jgi:hypothetical protein